MAIFTALAVTGAISTVTAVGLGVATYGTAYGVTQTNKSVKLGQQAVAVQGANTDYSPSLYLHL